MKTHARAVARSYGGVRARTPVAVSTPHVSHRPSPGQLTPATLLDVQRQAGNRAAQQLIAHSVGAHEVGMTHAPPIAAVQRGIVSSIKNLFRSKTAREKFNAKKFKLRNHVPPTGTGKFDADYNPKTGDLLITSKVFLNFKDSAEYADTATDVADTMWTPTGKQEWSQQFVETILEKWGNIPNITCAKPGFEDVVVKPKVNVVVLAKPGREHYKLDVSKAFTKKTGGMRTAAGSSGVTREGGGGFQEQDTKDKINDPKVRQHLQKTEQTTNIEPAFRRDRERMAGGLAGQGRIAFTANSAEIEPASLGLADTVATAILAQREYSALSHVHALSLKVVLGWGEQDSLVAARAQTVEKVLRGRGVLNPIAGEKDNAGDPSSGKIEMGPEGTGVQDYVANWSRMTSAHEFGHMIGLLDEYCPAVSPELLDKMYTEGQITDKNLTDYAKGKVGQNAPNQTAYARLLTETGQRAQNWARPTATKDEKSTSLMSGGFEMLKQHYVTIWDALAQMTKDLVGRPDWKL